MSLLFLTSNTIKVDAQNNKHHKVKADPTYPNNPQDYEGLNPAFPGGTKAYNEFIRKNITYKKGMKDGRVIVYFEIQKDGSLCNIHISTSLSKLNDDEVSRVFKLSPKWHPGILYGNPRQCAVNAPINFKK